QAIDGGARLGPGGRARIVQVDEVHQAVLHEGRGRDPPGAPQRAQARLRHAPRALDDEADDLDTGRAVAGAPAVAALVGALEVVLQRLQRLVPQGAVGHGDADDVHLAAEL